MVFNFAASDILLTQIAKGAPADFKPFRLGWWHYGATGTDDFMAEGGQDFRQHHQGYAIIIRNHDTQLFHKGLVPRQSSKRVKRASPCRPRRHGCR